LPADAMSAIKNLFLQQQNAVGSEHTSK